MAYGTCRCCYVRGIIRTQVVERVYLSQQRLHGGRITNQTAVVIILFDAFATADIVPLSY